MRVGTGYGENLIEWRERRTWTKWAEELPSRAAPALSAVKWNWERGVGGEGVREWKREK